MRKLAIGFACLLLGCGTPPPPRAPGPTAAELSSAEVAKLCDEYWQFLMREDPIRATRRGISQYNDKLMEMGPTARERRLKQRQEFLKRADALQLHSTGDATTIDLLKHELNLGIEEEECKFWQWEVDQMDGPQVWLFRIVDYHPLEKDEDRRTFVKRLEAFPRFIDEYIANLKSGMSEGRTAPRMAVDRVTNQLRSHLAKPVSEWPIAAAGGAAVTQHVRPAFEKLLAFFEKEYTPRESIGLSALPDGERAYCFCIRQHTTLDKTPRELHDLGLKELDAIEWEMRHIAKTQDLQEYRSKIMIDRANFARSREAYLEEFRAILKRIEDKLPHYFSRCPTGRYEVKPIETYREKDSVAAFYESGSDTRPGIFYANCYDPESRPRYNMPALAAHEAVPGHHLQIAFAQELRDLPMFRRHSRCTAFVEGWALYTERLADEMGIYKTELERFGMLTYQAWRAARLIVDTGIHALGWSRDQAIEFFKKHLAITETEIVNEIDRYIIWPGQALAYKVGQLEIEAIRKRASEQLGARFNLADFHVELLRHGAVPLPTLRTLMETWIAEQKKRRY